MITSVAYAKNIDYSPNFTAEEYWKSHLIYVAHVTKTQASDTPSASVTFERTAIFLNGPPAKTTSILVTQLWSWQNDGQPLQLKIGDYVLLVEPKTNNEPIVARKIGAPDKDPLVKTLTKIAELRKSGDPKQLLENANSSDDLVSEYCLKRLLETPNVKATQTHLGKLKAQRDDKGRRASVRILSHRLASKLSGETNAATAEYSWLQQTISTSKATDWQEVSPFVNRLIEFGDKRNDTAAFLTKLVKDAKVPLPVRIAAYGAFQDPRLFNFASPDKTSELIFATCIDMLKDKQPEIRSAGAALLHGITSRIDASKRKPFAERAKSALQTALKSEKNDATIHHLKTYRDLLDQ